MGCRVMPTAKRKLYENIWTSSNTEIAILHNSLMQFDSVVHSLLTTIALDKLATVLSGAWRWRLQLDAFTWALMAIRYFVRPSIVTIQNWKTVGIATHLDRPSCKLQGNYCTLFCKRCLNSGESNKLQFWCSLIIIIIIIILLSWPISCMCSIS